MVAAVGWFGFDYLLGEFPFVLCFAFPLPLEKCWFLLFGFLLRRATSTESCLVDGAAKRAGEGQAEGGKVGGAEGALAV